MLNAIRYGTRWTPVTAAAFVGLEQPVGDRVGISAGPFHCLLELRHERLHDGEGNSVSDATELRVAFQAPKPLANTPFSTSPSGVRAAAVSVLVVSFVSRSSAS